MRYSADDLPSFLKDVKTVIACKGKKVVKFDLSKDADFDELTKQVIGPSGNLRAPTFRRGKKVFVGFNADELASFMS